MRSKLKVVGVEASVPPVLVLVDLHGTVVRRRVSPRKLRALLKRHPLLRRGELSRCQLNRARVRSRGRGRCRDVGPISRATAEILGSDTGPQSCEVVSSGKMDSILKQHNWSSGDGVVGFHTPDQRVFVTKQWSLPHEWVHAAGLVDDRLGMWICEGLTESVAQEVARRTNTPYQPTYEYERSLVERQLAPALGMEPVELARQVVSWYAAGKAPAREMARLLGDPSLTKDLDRESGDHPTERLQAHLRKTNARP